jgi:hypothetical protein
MNEGTHHILDERTSNMKHLKISFCGKQLGLFEFHFIDSGHAIAAIQSKGMLCVCPDCKKIIIDLLNNELT